MVLHWSILSYSHFYSLLLILCIYTHIPLQPSPHLLFYCSYSSCTIRQPCRLMDPGIRQSPVPCSKQCQYFQVLKTPTAEPPHPLRLFLLFPRPNTTYNWFSLLSRINFTLSFLLVSCFNSYRKYEDSKIDESENFGDTHTWIPDEDSACQTFVWNIVPYRFEKLKKLQK